MSSALSRVSPVAALFLTHFDDIKGQNTVYFRSAVEGVVSDNIEHSSLPSGLHTTQQDFVLFRHAGLPAAGLFRSRDTTTTTAAAASTSASSSTSGAAAGGSAPRGRGRRMATLGVVLGPGTSADKLFDLQLALGEMYDRLESTGDFLRDAPAILDSMWGELPLSMASGADGSADEGAAEVALLLSRNCLGSSSAARGRRHPIEYISTLVAALGPSVVMVYKAALAGKRILLFSTPPLLPLSALAWCVWATSLPPPQSDAAPGTWLGHVGLMDLSSLSTRPGGWVATTSDAIFRSHPKAWDIFIDLSPLTLTPPSPQPRGVSDAVAEDDLDLPSGDPVILSSSPALVPSNQGSVEVTYAFSDLPLYKALLDPPGVGPASAVVGRRARRGWWLVFYDVVTGVFEVCRGVCEYALALNLVRGAGAGGGAVRLDDGEEDAQELDLDEDAPLLPRTGTDTPQDGDELEGEEEAVVVGRQILRILGHNTHHLYEQMRVMGAKSPARRLGEDEIRLLAGRWARAEERSWWWSLAKTWGL